MTIWWDHLKMVGIASAVSLFLCVVTILIAGSFEKSFMLFAPRPKWPLLLLLVTAWCVSLKIAYWWVFQRWTFYGAR